MTDFSLCMWVGIARQWNPCLSLALALLILTTWWWNGTPLKLDWNILRTEALMNYVHVLRPLHYKWCYQLIQIPGSFLWIDVIYIQALLLACCKLCGTSDWLAVWGRTSDWPIDYDRAPTQLIQKPMGNIYKTLCCGSAQLIHKWVLSFNSSLPEDLLSTGEYR